MWTLFLDGQSLGDGIQSTWSTFPNIPVGSLWIGQNQQPISHPSPGSFQGQITAFNMWNYKMSDSAIAMLAQTCVNIPGNVFRWSTFKNNVNGALKLGKPSTCKHAVAIVTVLSVITLENMTVHHLTTEMSEAALVLIL